jgi:hypothetical protein
MSFSLAPNARLYAVGRGISASNESFWPSATYWGERNPQYAMEPRLPYTACCNLAPFIFCPPASIAFREAIITEFTAKNATQSALDTFFLVPAFRMQTFVSTKYWLYISADKYFDRFGKQSLSSPLFSTDHWFRGH